jgi:raffinose/stachyose/melibiose transport system permease protein
VNTSSFERTASHVMLALFAVLALAPLVVVVLAAMHPSGTLLSGAGLPDSFSLATFRTAWDEGGFSQLMTSSAIVAVTVVALTTVLSIPAGYAFGTMRFPFADLLFYVILTGIVVPFESLIVPLYYSFRNVGLTDSYWGLILPQTGLSISFGVFWMRAFFRSLPPELSDAARVDGATSWRILWRVLVPIGRPAIVTMVLLVFMWTWNEFLLALVMISDQTHRTAPLGLSAFQSRYGVDIPGVSAAAVFVAAPVVILYVLTQRQFLRGMLAGSIKG